MFSNDSKFDPFNKISSFRKIIDPNDSKINRAADILALSKVLCKKAHCHKLNSLVQLKNWSFSTNNPENYLI